MLTRQTECVLTDDEREAFARMVRSDGWAVLVKLLEARYWRYVAKLTDPAQYRYGEMGHGHIIGRLREIEFIVEKLQSEVENNGTA